jgi:hypothetical protein
MYAALKGTLAQHSVAPNISTFMSYQRLGMPSGKELNEAPAGHFQGVRPVEIGVL